LLLFHVAVRVVVQGAQLRVWPAALDVGDGQCVVVSGSQCHDGARGVDGAAGVASDAAAAAASLWGLSAVVVLRTHASTVPDVAAALHSFAQLLHRCVVAVWR
jgi:hypothetical protein